MAAHPNRWLRPSSGWATAVPAIHERRHRLDLAEVTRWCEHAGFPAPIDLRSAHTPLVPGALDLAPVEVNRPGRPPLPYSHVELWFERGGSRAGCDRLRTAARFRALRPTRWSGLT